MPFDRNRIILEGMYTVEHNSTVRQTALAFKLSKSTIHKDITKKLLLCDKVLYEKVLVVIQKNTLERAIRGGEATKNKYKNKK